MTKIIRKYDNICQKIWVISKNQSIQIVEVLQVLSNNGFDGLYGFWATRCYSYFIDYNRITAAKAAMK